MMMKMKMKMFMMIWKSTYRENGFSLLFAIESNMMKMMNMKEDEVSNQYKMYFVLYQTPILVIVVFTIKKKLKIRRRIFRKL